MRIENLNPESIKEIATGREKITLEVPRELEGKVRKIHRDIFGQNGEIPPSHNRIKNFLVEVKKNDLFTRIKCAESDDESSEIFQQYFKLNSLKYTSDPFAIYDKGQPPPPPIVIVIENY